eukprot:Nitzschia sp. Nitz4//scaffold314_size20990//43//1341//NITZ4_008626-RA/size20990-processed-gene-0.15-mRNA-1//-1//CDS//3329547455//3711//frame0
MATDVVTCGKAVFREIVVGNGCTIECHRRYMLYLPCMDLSFLAPIVFSVHCLGCSTDTLAFWSQIASDYNFVWVNPEGIHRSFNAGDEACCGYALENGIDDIGFFQAIIDDLAQILPGLVSPDLVYGMGWSNGGYMVTAAARLFRAIAPVSGYQLNWETLKVDRPTGVFFHHSVDDNMVRITGCCTDPTMPSCCCQLSNFQDQCIALQDRGEQWATRINACSTQTSVTVFQSETQQPPTWESSSSSQITCTTYEQCSVNTTLCVYDTGSGHFNRHGFQIEFPMNRAIADFFARDACERFGGGQWSPEQRRCSCDKGDQNHHYCMDSASDLPSWSTSISTTGSDTIPSATSTTSTTSTVTIVPATRTEESSFVFSMGSRVAITGIVFLLAACAIRWVLPFRKGMRRNLGGMKYRSVSQGTQAEKRLELPSMHM